MPPFLLEPMWHRKRGMVVAIIGGLAVVGLTVGLLVATQSAPPTSTQAHANNVSRNLRACLAQFPAKDPGDAAISAAVWKGLQTADPQHINAQLITIPTGNSADAEPYINGLVERKCRLIVGVGSQAESIIAAAAHQHPDQNFAVMAASSPAPNIKTISVADCNATACPDTAATAATDAVRSYVVQFATTQATT